jgi:DNA-binding transcriptional ArsR family regulator
VESEVGVSAVERIMELKRGGMTGAQIAEELGMQRKTVYRHISRAGLGHAGGKGRRHWRNGATSAGVIMERDRDLLDESVLIDAREHAQKLCGRRRYSLEEVKGPASAAVIYRLVSVVGRLMECKGVQRYRELVRERDALRLELDACKAEMRRWEIAPPSRDGISWPRRSVLLSSP